MSMRKVNVALGALLGLLCTLAGCAGLLPMLVVPLFIRWDTQPTPGSYNEWPTIRGDLPWWMSWFSTPDERWPGGLYEGPVRDVFARYGRYVCCIYWYTRNSMHGLLPVFARAHCVTNGRPAADPDSLNYVQWKRWGLRGGYGWRWKPQNVAGSQWAEVPYFTIRRAAA